MTLWLAACGSPDASEPEISEAESDLAVQFALLTPNGDPRAALLSASESLTVDDRVTIGASGALEIAAAFGSPTTQIAAGVQAHANLTSKASVALRSNARVFGSVRSGAGIDKQTGARVDGGEFAGAAINGIPTQWTVAFPDSHQGNVALEPDQTRTLAPGSWGDLVVKSRSRVFLRTGTYFFSSMASTEPDAQILLDKSAGPIFIYVKSGLTLKGPMVSNGGLEGEQLIGYLGTAIASIESPLLGTIVAPSATVDLRRPSNNAPHRGAVFAKGIHVLSDATVIRLPFSWTFLCPVGDTDQDGVVDCVDGCWSDPEKTAPGLCGCGRPDTDGDEDGIADCIDQCDADPNNSVRGQCGCPPSSAKPAGARCTDSPCVTDGATTLTCDGAGVCGNPNACAPATGCIVRRFGTSYYWFCPGPVSWDQAAASCRAFPGRALARINTPLENDFIRGLVTGTWWTGGNDRTTAGTWRWANSAGNDGDPFWSGGPTGSATANRFARWTGGQPDPALRCGAVSADGSWTARACSAATGFVCEQTVSLAPPAVPPLDCGKFFPARACSPAGGDSPRCVPAESVFTSNDTQQAFNEIEACRAAGEAGTCTADNRSGCTAACVGAATVPPGNSVCPPFDAEEISFCGLMNTVEAGCTAGEDCCEFTTTVFVSSGTDPVSGSPIPQGFDAGTAGFAYVDDAFRGSGAAAPAFASGVRVTSAGHPGAAVQITLGGIDNTTVTNMSGAWQTSFTLGQQAVAILTFDYQLSQTPDYEADERSQLLVSLDGERIGRAFEDLVDQVQGDGNGGPAVTSGWKTFSRNLGRLGPGTHTVAIGGHSNQKTANNESTTILIDNVVVLSRADTCTGDNICGPAYASGCNPCDVQDESGKCLKDCGSPALRCGLPLKQPVTPHGGVGNCADSSLFPEPLCQQIEICSDPDATGTSDPTAGGTLDPDPAFDPTELGTAAPAPTTQYVPDPPCAGPLPCSAGEAHRWCSYRVDTWNDPAIPAQDRPANPVPPRQTPPTGKEGSSGSSLVTFTFHPDIGFDMSSNPLPFGESQFELNAHANLLASVGFELGSNVKGSVDIINASLSLHATRCMVTDEPSHLTILGEDFFPESLLFTTKLGDTALCNTALTDFENAVNRAKKAYRDAIELMKQYNALKNKIPQQRFPDDFCQKVAGQPPAGFPAGNCGTETPAATINRFIEFYRNQVTGELRQRFDALANFGLQVQIPDENGGVPPPTRETQTIFQTTIPIGPLPLLLQVEAFAEYGLDVNLTFNVTPLGGAAGGFQEIAKVSGIATPYALAGIDLFVGVGFDVNGFSASAGVQGAVTLGRMSIDAHAGAGIGVEVTPDTRDLPPDIKDAAPGASSTQTLFPPGGAKSYTLGLTYDYGMGVNLAQILAGDIAARLRIKFFFFSKTWRKVLMSFPGFSLPTLPLISGGGNIAAVSGDPFGWGTIQMPLPFVDLPELDPGERLTGTAVPLDTAAVEELFYDSLCTCQEDSEPCTRNDDCCGQPTSVCFSDPAGPPGTAFCSGCRQTHQSCRTTSDCCGSPSAVCLGGECQCVPEGLSCSSIDNCCPIPGDSTSTVRTCEDDAKDNLPDTPVCRYCRHQGEVCTTADDCCTSDLSPGAFRTCDTGADGVKRCGEDVVK